MASAAISALTAITSGYAIGDLLALVDVSDTTQAPAGTTKKTTLGNLLSALPGNTNAIGLGITGFSLTGANAQSLIDVSGTWNTSGTPTLIKGYVTDTASNASSLLLDLGTGSTSRFNVVKDGTARSTKNGGIGIGVYVSGQNPVGFGRNSTVGGMSFWGAQASPSDSNAEMHLSTTQLLLASTTRVAWSSSNITQAADIGQVRKAAGVHEFNTGTTGVYAGTAWGSGSQTVAQLPAAATAGKGARTFVTDATATTFASTVAGGGANNVPVVSDGTNWIIG